MNGEDKMSMFSGGAVVILSGGLDSSTAAYIAASRGHTPLYAITFNYGQTLVREISSAKTIAAYLAVQEHRIVWVPINEVGKGALIDNTPIPKDRDLARMAEEIPATYVTFRNGIFLSLATAYAEAKGVDTIYGGWNQIDFSGYPDCRREFFRAFEQVMLLGTRAGVEEGQVFSIQAPLLMMGKAQIIELGLSLGVPYQLTWSCYVGGDTPCHRCDSCRLREAGFAEIGRTDPLCS